MIDFRDLDNPRFMAFTRSPEFSTYLTMRRHIWRSLTQHSRGIEQLYAQGYLCCGLSREKIAKSIGGEISKRTVTNDIARLVELRVIAILGTGYDQVFVLGRWEKKEGVHVEYYYLDRLTPPLDTLETFFQGTADSEANPGKKLLDPLEESCHTPWKETSTMNRESMNTELRIDGGPALWKAVKEELKLQLTSATFDQWINRTTARREDGRLVIACASEYARDWLANRVATTIKRTVAGILGEDVELAFEVKE